MSAPIFQNKRILVVEDDDMSYVYLSHLLTIGGASFYREKTGAGAIQLYNDDTDFDVVLMDIQLPDMDGCEVTRRLKRMNRELPVIGQTASPWSPDFEQMIQAGCTSVLIKPFSMEQLFSELEKVLKI